MVVKRGREAVRGRVSSRSALVRRELLFEAVREPGRTRECIVGTILVLSKSRTKAILPRRARRSHQKADHVGHARVRADPDLPQAWRVLVIRSGPEQTTESRARSRPCRARQAPGPLGRSRAAGPRSRSVGRSTCVLPQAGASSCRACSGSRIIVGLERALAATA